MGKPMTSIRRKRRLNIALLKAKGNPEMQRKIKLKINTINKTTLNRQKKPKNNLKRKN